MKRDSLIVGLVLAGAVVVQPLTRAEEVDGNEPPPAEQGYRMVQKVEYKEIEHRYCKMVPDKRKRWVYCTKPDYYCLPPCPIPWPWRHKDCCQCGPCRSCIGPLCRPQLIKKEVEWECGTKCEIQVVKEKVPVLVWRKEAISPKKKGSSKSAPRPADRKRERLPPPRPVSSGSEEEAQIELPLGGQQEP